MFKLQFILGLNNCRVLMRKFCFKYSIHLFSFKWGC